MVIGYFYEYEVPLLMHQAPRLAVSRLKLIMKNAWAVYLTAGPPASWWLLAIKALITIMINYSQTLIQHAQPVSIIEPSPVVSFSHHFLLYFYLTLVI